MANPKYKAKVEDFPGGRKVSFDPQEEGVPSIPAKFYYEGDEDFDKYTDGHLYAFGEEATQPPSSSEAQAPPEPAAAELAPTKRAAKKGK